MLSCGIDDDPDLLRSWIEAYREQTTPLLDYYRGQGILHPVDGMFSASEWVKPSTESSQTDPKEAFPGSHP